MSLSTKIRQTLKHEGPRGVLKKGVVYLARRSPRLRKALAEREWQSIESTISGETLRDYNNAWGEARRKLYGRWGPLPCNQHEVKRLQSLHNKYKGNRIFVMGNGPSLNQTPLEKLANEYTFGVNRIYLLFDRISWRPSFYTALDWRVTPDTAHDILTLRDMTFFFPQRFWGMLRTGEDVYWYYSQSCSFSHDASKGVCGTGSITGTAIQLAYYMGFDPIYLIGVDTTYKVHQTVKQEGKDTFGTGVKLYLESTKDDDPNHFDPRYFGQGSKWHDPNVAAMIQGFQHCKEATESQGRKIYNATVGGQLEVFERVDIHSLF
jgi:hypothetical protein